LQERDARDSARAVAPLKKGEADAKLLDTTGWTIEQAVQCSCCRRYRANSCR
jgi:3-phosphoshikimate 1-carboxyvinyltransferase